MVGYILISIEVPDSMPSTAAPVSALNWSISMFVALSCFAPKLFAPAAFWNITNLFAGNIAPAKVILYLPVEVYDHVIVPLRVFCCTVATGAAVPVCLNDATYTV